MAGMDMMIATALENMLPKLLANLPPELSETIGQIGQTMAGFKAQLDRIENQNRVIQAALKILPPDILTEDGHHERQVE